MTIRAMLSVAMGLALLTSGGCQQARSIRDDFSRAFSSQPTSQSRSVAASRPVARTKATSGDSAKSTATGPYPAAADAAANPPAPPPPNGPAVQLAGKSENELRALLGSPTNEEERPPGKRWRYRDGQCTLDVQLYPDVRTKQFGTLAYEVKSDDNTDEGRRHCLAQLQSRVQAGR